MLADSGSARSSGVVGACISGQLRTFFLPCVGAQMRDNVLLPLRARTFVALNHPGNGTVRHDIKVNVHRLLTGVHLLHVRVDAGNGTRTLPDGTILMGGGAKDAPPQPCPTPGNTYQYTTGLLQCYEGFQADAIASNVSYTWVLRLRSDHHLPARFGALPARLPYDPDDRRGVAILGSLGACECGWTEPACDARREVERAPSGCLIVDDTFALLHGPAIDLYLRSLREHWCDEELMRRPFEDVWRLKRWTLGHIGAEGRLGHLLSAKGVVLRDVRFISQNARPRLQRSSDCMAPRDTPQPVHKGVVIDVPAEAWEQVPPGPADQRIVSICAAQRALPAASRALCLPYGPAWDDELLDAALLRKMCGKDLASCGRPAVPGQPRHFWGLH